jgi:glycerol-3-phosphate dehydrogenase
MFYPGWRDDALAKLDATFDVIVIGGGITGAGIFMDAAQRGLNVLLLESRDIGSGTSSRSSKLIHGGLRYLKQMQFRITRVACRERDRMLALNPDLVRPIRFLYPAREGDATPAWTIGLGLWMYDRLTAGPEKHADITPEEVREAAPGLNLEGMQRALAYNDAVTDDARLTLAVAATGLAYGGILLTRAEAVESVRDEKDRIRGVVVGDVESGTTHTVSAHVVVNAAGVWVDRIREAFQLPGTRLRPARGSHIVFPASRIPLKAALTVPSPDDGRPVFLIPHAEGVLMGTTDIYHDGSIDDPRPTQPEVEYLLRAAQAQFPESDITNADIVGAFAGVRPILDTHADNPSEASRDEDVWEEQGMVSVAGGKLTTWRQTAEETVDAAVKLLPQERAQRAAPCYTHGTPLVGLAPPGLQERLRQTYPMPQEVAEAMATRLRGAAWYGPLVGRGKRHGLLARLRAASPTLRGMIGSGRDLHPIVDGTDLCAAEVRAHLMFGGVLHLEDLLLRRARVGLWQPAMAEQVAPRLRPLFRQEFGWNNRRWTQELEAFQEALAAWSVRGVR